MVFVLGLKEHYDIIEARDGTEAWKLVQEQKPRVVVTDLNMPGMNGMELTEHIKTHETLRNTVVLIVTGTIRNTDLPAGFWNMGTKADKMLEKPVTPSDILAEIRRLLILKAQPQPLPPGSGSYEKMG